MVARAVAAGLRDQGIAVDVAGDGGAGLDPEQRVAFRALLRDLGERSTVIVSTHLVEDVGAACGEVALMDAGKIVFRGAPDELTARGEGSGAAVALSVVRAAAALFTDMATFEGAGVSDKDA